MIEPFARWGRLYAALAPLVLGLSFLPPFAVGGTGINATVESFGTVWDMASTPAGAPARAAVALLLMMFGCLLAAALWPSVPALPCVNAFAGAAIGLLLWTRPATGDPAPALSATGKTQLVVAAGIVVISAIHLGQLTRHRRQAGQRRAGTAPADTPPGHLADQARAGGFRRIGHSGHAGGNRKKK